MHIHKKTIELQSIPLAMEKRINETRVMNIQCTLKLKIIRAPNLCIEKKKCKFFQLSFSLLIHSPCSFVIFVIGFLFIIIKCFFFFPMWRLLCFSITATVCLMYTVCAERICFAFLVLDVKHIIGNLMFLCYLMHIV